MLLLLLLPLGVRELKLHREKEIWERECITANSKFIGRRAAAE
jgi:hypothetical protein